MSRLPQAFSHLETDISAFSATKVLQIFQTCKLFSIFLQKKDAKNFPAYHIWFLYLPIYPYYTAKIGFVTIWQSDEYVSILSRKCRVGVWIF